MLDPFDISRPSTLYMCRALSQIFDFFFIRLISTYNSLYVSGAGPIESVCMRLGQVELLAKILNLTSAACYIGPGDCTCTCAVGKIIDGFAPV